MIYSTLKEVYDVDTFEKKKKKKCKDVDNEYLDISEIKETKDPKKAKELYMQPAPTQCATPPSRKQNMVNVKPFLDDELEHYFNFNDYQNSIPKPQVLTHPASNPSPPPVAEQAGTPPQSASAEPVKPAEPVKSQASVATPGSKSKQDMYYKNLINIGLFIFIGILIIFLCDQITEIAVNIGMKKTVYILEPYLIRLEKLHNLQKADI